MIASNSIQIILISGSHLSPKGIIATLSASATTAKSRPRIHYTPPNAFAQSVKEQIQHVILPQVDLVTRQLGLRQRNFTLELQNIGISAIADRHYQLTGFSADLPIFLALLASACRVNIPASTAATGHISGKSGTVAIVSNLPEKIRTCHGNPRIKHLIIPSVDTADSLASLAPEIHLACRTAIKSSRGPLQITEVSHLSEALRHAWSNEAIVLGSLRTGFFGRRLSIKLPSRVSETISRAADDKTFWHSLKRNLCIPKTAGAKELLKAYIDFHFRRKRYPHSLNDEIDLVLKGIPKTKLHRALSAPVISDTSLRKLKKLGGGIDSLKIATLLSQPVTLGATEDLVHQDELDPLTEAHANLDQLVYSLSEPRLSQTTGRSIDAARASFALNSSTVSSHQEFLDILASFYIHAASQAGLISRAPSDQDALSCIIPLVNQAYPSYGIETAEAHAISGTSGGIGTILDKVSTTWREQIRADFIDYQIKLAVDSTNRQRVGDLLQAFAMRYPQHVPFECRFQPVNTYVDRCEEILVAFFKSANSTRTTTRNY